MSVFDEIKKFVGMPAGPAKGAWPRVVNNNELWPERIPVQDDYEPPPGHGFQELKIGKNGRVGPAHQPKRRLPQELRYVRDSDQHNAYLRDGGLPPPGDDE